MEIFIEENCYNEDSSIDAYGLLLLHKNGVKMHTDTDEEYSPNYTKINLGYGFFYFKEETYTTIYKNDRFYTIDFPLTKNIKTNPNFIKTIKQNPDIYKGKFDIINIPDNIKFKYLFGVDSPISECEQFETDVPDVIITENNEIIQSKKLKFDLYKYLI